MFAISGTTTISGYATDIKVNQTVAAPDGPNLAQIDHATITGNAVGIDLGNNSVVHGSLQTQDKFVTSGSATFTPGYPVSLFMIQNTTSPVIASGPHRHDQQWQPAAH